MIDVEQRIGGHEQGLVVVAPLLINREKLLLSAGTRQEADLAESRLLVGRQDEWNGDVRKICSNGFLFDLRQDVNRRFQERRKPAVAFRKQAGDPARGLGRGYERQKAQQCYNCDKTCRHRGTAHVRSPQEGWTSGTDCHFCGVLYCISGRARKPKFL